MSIDQRRDFFLAPHRSSKQAERPSGWKLIRERDALPSELTLNTRACEYAHDVGRERREAAAPSAATATMATAIRGQISNNIACVSAYSFGSFLKPLFAKRDQRPMTAATIRFARSLM